MLLPHDHFFDFVLNVPRSNHWPTVRAAHLAKENFCQACGGVDHLEVHHIIPVHIDPALELVESNLITLCMQSGHSCHFIFGHLFSWKRYNKDVRLDVAGILNKIHGYGF